HVNTGSTNPDGTQAIQCHQNLPLQQFDDCFKFTTFPKLGPNSTTFPGHQFQKYVTTAVCYVLFNNEDVRSEWVQLWASDNGANFRKLPESSDAGLLSVDNRYCFNPPPIGDNSTGFRGLASAGWRKLKGGLGQIFGIQTAYGVDLGLGGTILDFSNISPALSTQIDTAGLFGEGLEWTANAKITGITHHGGVSAGINGLPVTFTVAAADGNFGFDEEEQPITQVIVQTGTNDDPAGVASVNWNVASTPGPHTITATGPACLKTAVPSDSCLIGPITFTVVVPPPIP
ncbi:MAG TPA: hypothetical protein VK560_09385, partial [Gemmatimonadaceae bacterium]|nr:hypothetical protein [Gemmatimonadaceae bacterium]